MRSKSGFTIVELLIVIVVIGILAAFSLVAYNGIQAKANDSRRLNDVSLMNKALRLYKVDNGAYPNTQPNPGFSTFEISSDPGFLSSLSAYTNSAVFRDPQHTTTLGYRYKLFTAGEYGCPASQGPYALVWVRDGMQTQSSPRIDSGPCPGQTLFVTTPTPGAYTVDSNDYVLFLF